MGRRARRALGAHPGELGREDGEPARGGFRRRTGEPDLPATARALAGRSLAARGLVRRRVRARACAGSVGAAGRRTVAGHAAGRGRDRRPRRDPGRGDRPRPARCGRPARAGDDVRAWLPAGALDGAAEVRTRGDVFVPLVLPAESDDALAAGDTEPLPHGRLLAAAAQVLLPARPRVLTDAGPARAVEAWLAPLLADGSVVLVAPGLVAGDPERLERIAEQEQVDLRLL